MEFLDTVGKFISSKNYANKGIRTKDGKVAYVTSTGITKQYSSPDVVPGPNCPNEFVQVDQTWQNLGFPVGKLMQNGQSCGNEGKYVRSEPPSTDFDWRFYLQNNGDLSAAGLKTEQQAINHWNNIGKAEGRIPNATIFSSMGDLGKVGYVDVDTAFHSVEADYSYQYSAFPNRTNITGTDMKDCSTPVPPLKYGDTVVLMCNNQTGFLNSSSVLQFGTGKTNLFLRPPPGDDRNGIIIKSGDVVSISSSSSSYTNECGWWGCKVAKISDQKQLLFSAGGGSPQQFTILSLTVGKGQEMRMDHSFYLISIPQSNKEALNLNNSVRCKAGTGGGYGAVYRYSGSNNLNLYPSPEIANSWDSNWTNAKTIDCSTYKFGETDKKNNAGGLKIGDAAICRINEQLPNGVYGGVYRYVGENMLRWYPNKEVATSWDRNFQKNKKEINCTSYVAGPPMTLEKTEIGKELIETPRFVYVSNGISLLGSSGEIDLRNAIFSFQTPIYNRSCKIDSLKTTCNQTGDCIGFVQAPATNSWQMIKKNSSAGNYKITSTMQDVYLRDAIVDVLDNSCDPGPVSFIKGTVLKQYPEGPPFVKGQGNNKCKIIQAPKGKVTDNLSEAKQFVNDFPTLKFDTDSTLTMKKKTKEYEDVMQSIENTLPDVTLEQQYTDMTVFDEQNRTALIVWSVLSLSILGFVFFRMKS